MENIKDLILEYVNTKPEVNGIYGYGSGVFKQSGYTEKDKPQIDLILTVNDMKKWHLENMKLNKEDYSFTGRLFLAKYDKSPSFLGSQITYVPYLKYKGHKFKIGVVSRDELLNDLRTWRSFFLPGRMQKPTMFIKTDDEVKLAIEENRKNALILGLLMLYYDSKTENDLYQKICSLSYKGDIRTFGFESPKKIENTVKSNIEMFRDIYVNDDFWSLDDNNLVVQKDKIIYEKLKLPKEFWLEVNNYQEKKKYKLTQIECINRCIIRKNFTDSSIQTLKGLATAGPVKSSVYVGEKFIKYVKSIVKDYLLKK